MFAAVLESTTLSANIFYFFGIIHIISHALVMHIHVQLKEEAAKLPFD